MGSCQVIYFQRTNQRANLSYREVLEVKMSTFIDKKVNALSTVLTACNSQYVYKYDSLFVGSSH